MPIFEFQCKECRNEFKTLRRTDKLEGITCPACGAIKVLRLLSVTAQSASASSSEACGMPMGACCGMNASGCGCRN